MKPIGRLRILTLLSAILVASLMQWCRARSGNSRTLVREPGLKPE